MSNRLAWQVRDEWLAAFQAAPTDSVVIVKVAVEFYRAALDHPGNVHPSATKIAERIGHDVRTVKAARKALAEGGWLTFIRAHSGRTPTTYALAIPATVEGATSPPLILGRPSSSGGDAAHVVVATPTPRGGDDATRGTRGSTEVARARPAPLPPTDPRALPWTAASPTTGRASPAESWDDWAARLNGHAPEAHTHPQ